ncbi:TolC family protein [Candidatus Parcubacteria bacterium]|nr:MAG: TolC family protein [Candidatus Parcubacteria bacterium]
MTFRESTSGKTKALPLIARAFSDSVPVRHGRFSAIFMLAFFCGSSPVLAKTISLLQYTRLALENSDSVMDSREELKVARLNVDITSLPFKFRLVPLARVGFSTGAENQKVGIEARGRSEFGTNITIGAAASRITYNEFNVDKPDTVQTYIRLSQGLLRNWGRQYNRSGLTLEELRLQKQRLSYIETQQKTLLEAIRRYYKYILAKMILEQSKKNLSRARKHLMAVKSRVAIGLVPKSDELQSRIAVLNAESAVEENKLLFRTALDNFIDLANLCALSPPAVRSDISLLIPVVPENWQALVPERHPKWQAWEIDKHIFDIKILRARRNLLPDLSVDVTVGRRGTEPTFGKAAKMNQMDWSVQFNLNSPLNPERSSIILQREQIRLNRFLRTGRKLKQQLLRKAREAMAKLHAAERKMRIAAATRIQTMQALELARIRYRRGLDSNLTLIDAEAKRSKATIDWLRARVDYNLAAAKLAADLGILDLDWLRLSLSDPHD